VIAQDTGFRDHLPTGAGLFSFSTIPDVLEAIDCLREDYNRHTTKARELAEELFDSQKVLPRLLDAVGC
jgi:hypothetical protein